MAGVNDGGPAFPNITPDMQINGGPGMSLRDYFSAKAMQALLAATWGIPNDTERPPSNYFSKVAKFSLEVADAMLAERKQNLRAQALEGLK